MQKKVNGATIAFALAVLLAVPAVGSAATPSGWLRDATTDHWYMQVNDMTRSEAEAYAVSLGGHLVTINDQAEQDWLAMSFSEPNLWIGLERVGGGWAWASGEPSAYTNWAPGEPNNAEEPWVVMNWRTSAGQDTWQWNDLGTGSPEYPVTRSSVIEIATAPDLTWMYNPGTDHYYAQVNGMTWPESEAFAVTLGGHLVTVDDAAEQAWLSSTFTQDNLWIGFNDIEANGAWVWSSGAPVSYTNWADGEPNDGYAGEEDGAVMNFADYRGRLGTTWNDYPIDLGCTFYGPSICSGLAGIVEVTQLPDGFEGGFTVNIGAGEDGTGQYVHGWGWGDPVTISIDATSVFTDLTLDPDGGFMAWSDEIWFTPGDIVTVSDGVNEKSLVVAELAVSSIDLATGQVAGTCDVGMDVALEYSSYEGQPPPVRLTVECTDGAFAGDFGSGTLPQADPNDPEARGSYVEARQSDTDGDITQVDAYYPFATTASARADKVVVPTNTGAEAEGWEMTLSWDGGSETVTTVPMTDPDTGIDLGRAVFATVLEDGVTYTITEGEKGDGWIYGEGQGDCSFTVDYPADAGRTFSCSFENRVGFLDPVDSPPTVNTVKAGRSIPLMFNLGGYYDPNILMPGSPTSQAVACGSLPSDTDPIEQTVASGGGGVTYDPLTGTYTYIWKTNKAWAATCRHLILTMWDGVEIVADFRFAK